MRIVLEDVPDELARELLTLLGRADELKVAFPAQWTVSRATALLRDLPTSATTIIRAAAAGEHGWAPGDALRGPDGTASLRGRTGAITKAIQRGTARKAWPAEMPAPIEVVYDPDEPGYRRMLGVQMNEEWLPVFRAAIERVDADV